MQPSTSAAPPPDPKPPTRVAYRLQTQAFVDAADEVDIEEDVWEDLLSGFGEDDFPEGPDHAMTENMEPDDIDFSEFDEYAEEAGAAWSSQEVRAMAHNLKEKGMAWWISEYVVRRSIPIPKLLYAFDIVLCRELREKRMKTQLYFLRVAMSRLLSRRERLTAYNTIDDAVSLIRNAKRVIMLTGAGISVSCGIPDFRSADGLYAQLKQRGEYDLDDPQQMFDIHYFKEHPSVFYSFASQIYPSNFSPSPCHRFIKMMEDRGKLLRNYTQNIDTLETLAGVTNVIQCHGSFATASCIECRTRVSGKDIEDDILRRRIPYCKLCAAEQAKSNAAKKPKRKKKKSWNGGESSEDEFQPRKGLMKPDITFFGEKLDDKFDRSLEADREQVDLLIVIGTSLKVAPVADMILHIPHSVPQILINKTPVKHINPDVVLLGNADNVITHLCERLGWELPHVLEKQASRGSLRKRPSGGTPVQTKPRRVAESHVWLFEGAEGGKWVEDLEAPSGPSTTREGSPLSDGSSLSNQAERSDEGRFAKRVRLE